MRRWQMKPQASMGLEPCREALVVDTLPAGMDDNQTGIGTLRELPVIEKASLVRQVRLWVVPRLFIPVPPF